MTNYELEEMTCKEKNLLIITVYVRFQGHRLALITGDYDDCIDYLNKQPDYEEHKVLQTTCILNHKKGEAG